MPERTDAETVATFMEPMPDYIPQPYDGLSRSPNCWWTAKSQKTSRGGFEFVWVANEATLDMLHEVEARLTDRQWERYCLRLVGCGSNILNLRGTVDYADLKALLHASAADKLTALAAVIREAANG